MNRFVSIGWRADLLQGNLSTTLDWIRWLAALAVCVAHLRTGLFPDAEEAHPETILVRAFYFLTLFPVQAVVVFFVISGLLVGGPVLRRIIDGNFMSIDYAIDRATRLLIVLIPAIALSVVLIWFGNTTSCQEPTSLWQILGNLTLVQNISVYPICNNHPLWSLSNEAFYYAAFPIIVYAAVTRSIKAIIVTGIFTIVAVCTMVFRELSAQNIAFAFAIWLVGLMPWYVRLKIPVIVPLSVLMVVLFCSRLDLFRSEYVSDILIAISFGLVLCCPFGEKPFKKQSIKIPAFFAGFSYSLYLVHMPIAQLEISIVQRRLDPDSIASYVIFFVGLLLIIFAAWLFGLLFERQTPKLRRRIRLTWARHLRRRSILPE